MSTKNVNLETAYRVIREVWGGDDAEKARALFQKYGISGTRQFTINQSGEFSVSYQVRGIPGVLRFRHDGIYDGLNKTGEKRPYTAISFLEDLLEGKASPFHSSLGGPFETEIFQGAITLYECYTTKGRNADCSNAQAAIDRAQEGKREARTKAEIADASKKTTDLLKLANQMLDLARKEDEGPGGWDPDDFKDIVDEKSRLIGALPSDTEEGTKERLAAANAMIAQAAATWTGARACVTAGACETITRTTGDCYKGKRFETTYRLMGGTAVRVEQSDSCQEIKEYTPSK